MSFEPYVISWNLTKRCNLKCQHCYLDADELTSGGKDELSTEECYRVLDEIAEVNPGVVLILTGGEPLLRPDIFDISRYAVNKGMLTVLGTNGIGLTEEKAKKLRECGVAGVGISLDSLDKEKHDSFRGLPGAFDASLRGIEAAKKAGLDYQVQTTVTEGNFNEIEEIIRYSHSLGAKVFNLFFLVCTGRGEEMTDISAERYEEMLKKVYDLHDKFDGMLIRSKCAPHFKRIAHQKDPQSPLLEGYVGGCRAGTNYCRITPEGKVTPCPYMPEEVGSLREDSFGKIWQDSPLFGALRVPEYKGKCQSCEYKMLCGGCRARAFAEKGDTFGEDPWCGYDPPEEGKQVINIETAVKYDLLPESKISGDEPLWSPEAEEFLAKIPFFARTIAKKGAEKYARGEGISLITPETMKAAMEKRMGKSVSRPQFGKKFFRR